MKTIILVSILSALLLTSAAASAKDVYPHKFSELQIRDYDDMLSMVDKKIADARAIAIKNQEEGVDDKKEAVDKLQDAMQIVLSRPDKDNMVAKLFPQLKKELSNFESFEIAMVAVSAKALNAIKNENLDVNQRATGVYVLENMLSELQPLMNSNPKIKDIVKHIRDVKLDIPNKVKSHRKLTSMDNTPDISEIAGKMLERAEKEAAAKKKPSEAKPTQNETAEED